MIPRSTLSRPSTTCRGTIEGCLARRRLRFGVLVEFVLLWGTAEGYRPDQRLKKSAFTSVAHLQDDIGIWAEGWNENPTPFIWKRSAEEIIAKVKRGRATLASCATKGYSTSRGAEVFESLEYLRAALSPSGLTNF